MRSWDSFDIIIRRKGDQFFAGVPEIGLYARGADPIAALGALDQRKREIVNELGADFEPFAITPPHGTQQRSGNSEIGRFALKLVVVVFLLGGSSIFAAKIVASKAEQSLDQLRAALSAPHVGAVVRRQIERSADAARNVPNTEKQKLAEDVRAIAERWRPIANEIMSVLFSSPSCQPNGCAKPN